MKSFDHIHVEAATVSQNSFVDAQVHNKNFRGDFFIETIIDERTGR